MTEAKEKFVLVPQADIDRLEEARVFLLNELASGFLLQQLLTHVTPAMWRVAHRKYPEGIEKT